MSAMERTELKMAVIAEQLGLSWAGNIQQTSVCVCVCVCVGVGVCVCGCVL